MTLMSTARSGDRRGGRGRLLGIDAARAVALVGMMAVHILPSRDESGRAAWYYQVAGGRSSALFAVLAGVGLALASGGADTPSGSELRASRRATAARAALLALVGLVLGTIDSGVAVILVHYGLLFMVGALLLGLARSRLWVLAAVTAVVTPVVSHLARAGGQPGPQVPGLDDLANPLTILGDLVLTGYYPVLTWSTYLIVGLAIGRTPLTTSSVAWRLLAGGAGVAVASRLGSTLLLRSADLGELPVQYFGTAPTDSWWYLGVVTPHSGATFDLLHTAGSAAALIGLFLLLAAFARRSVVWLAGAGGMTFTLYSAHVLALASRAGLDDRPRLFAIHATLALVVGGIWRAIVGRGPLETLAAQLASVARGPATSTSRAA